MSTSSIGYEQLNRLRNWPSDWGGDKTGVQDASAAFLAALEHAGSIHIPAGHTYLISSKVVVEQFQSITGDGWSSVILVADDLAEAALSLQADTSLSNFRIGRFSITGSTLDQITAGSRAIEILGDPGAPTAAEQFPSHIKLDRIQAWGVESGVYINTAGVVTLDSCLVRTCTQGLHLGGTQANVITSIDSEYFDCVTGVLDATNGAQVAFYGGAIEGNRGYGYRSTTQSKVNRLFDGVYFELNGTGLPGGSDAYDLKAEAAASINNLVVRECWFNNTKYAIYLLGALGGRIENNYFQNNTKSIYLGGSFARAMMVGYNRIGSNAAYFTEADDLGSGTVYDGCHTPAQFGAYGDGSTDSTAALQAWIDAFPTRGSDLDARMYIIGSPGLVLPTNYRLADRGWLTSVLKAATGYAGPVVTCATRNVLLDLYVQGVATASSLGIDAGTAFSVVLERVSIHNFPKLISIAGANTDWTIRRCRLTAGATAGVEVSGASGDLTLEDNLIDACGTGILLSGTPIGVQIVHNTISNCTSRGIDVTGSSQNVNVERNRLTGNAVNDCRVNANSRAFRFVGNRADAPTCLTAANGTGGLVESNVFNPSGGAPKSLELTNPACVRWTIGLNVYLAGAFGYGTDNAGFATRYLGQILAAAAPSSGIWEVGERVYNIAPASGQPEGWACSAAPATFLPLANLP